MDATTSMWPVLHRHPSAPVPPTLVDSGGHVLHPPESRLLHVPTGHAVHAEAPLLIV